MVAARIADDYGAATTATSTTITEEQRRFFLQLPASHTTASIEEQMHLVSEPSVPQQNASVGRDGDLGDGFHDTGSDSLKVGQSEIADGDGENAVG